MKKNVYIYNDIGVSENSINHTKYTIEQIISDEYKTCFINAAELIKQDWLNDAALFVMPGGADIHYKKKLDGKGNDIIKEYVKKGGSYLGICAGAYYGSAFIEFDKNDSLEIIGDRELGFFPGKAIGPVIGRYNYNDNSGASAITIKTHISPFNDVVTYYNGGPYFEYLGKYKNVDIISSYKLDNKLLPAILHISYYSGMVILSGVHFEYSHYLLDNCDKYHTKIIHKLEETVENRLNFVRIIFKNLKLKLKD